METIAALAAKQLDAVTLLNTADRLSADGRPDLAAQLYQLWINTHPLAPERGLLLYNLSIALAAGNDLGGAVAALGEALDLDPEFHAARVNQGVFLARAGQTEAAVEAWRDVTERLSGVTPEALRLKRIALRHLAHFLEHSQREDEAEPLLREIMGLDPHDSEVMEHWISTRQAQCRWPLLEAVEGIAPLDLRRAMPPLALAAFTDDPWLLLATGAGYTRSRVGLPAALPAERRPPPLGPEARDRRLRLGYLSSDLRGHAVGSLIPEVFEGHDRTRVEVVAFYTGPQGADPHHLRLRRAADAWHDLSALDDRAAALCIVEAGIDILVDLNGHTDGTRPGVVGLQPAPVIVNWLGYPGTTGSPVHHYIIADSWIIPPSHEKYYSERVLRLPCYQPNDRYRAVAETPTRAEAGVPDEAGVVFCCFNAAYKITRPTFDRWMTILRAVPEAVLWLLDPGATTRARLEAEAEARGVAAHRLVYAPKVPNPQHLARYALADLFLDTFPYGAHTTASDALWRGVPVLTWSGRSFASRVCGSLVRAAGLPDLVCDGPDDYVARAIALGRDRAALALLRERLDAARPTAPLFDMETLVRSLEDLYDGMREAAISGALPVPDLTDLAALARLGATLDPDAEEIGARADYDALYRALVEAAALPTVRGGQPLQARLADPPPLPIPAPDPTPSLDRRSMAPTEESL